MSLLLARSLALSVVVVAIAGAAEFTLPAAWAGIKIGAAEGNPAVINGKPLWRVDQVWPADPTEFDDYVPMTWTGKDWGVQANGFGGQPGATTAGKTISLGIRGPWDGASASRTAALVFISPVAGAYTISSKLDVSRWAGDQNIAVHLYRRDPVKKSVRPVAEIPVEVKEGNVLAATATLAAGEELLFIAEIGAFHTAGGVTFRDLLITGP